MKHSGVEEYAPSFCGEGSRIEMFVDLDSPTFLSVLMRLNCGSSQGYARIEAATQEKRAKEIGGCS